MVVTPGPAQLGSVPYLDLIFEFDSPGHRADTCDSFQPSDWLERGPRALSLAGLNFVKGGLPFGETYFIH